MSGTEVFQVGELTYNGWTFPGAIHATVEGVPISDSTGRTTKYVRYNIRVETIVYPGVDNAPDLFPATMPTADGDPSNVGTKGIERIRKLLTVQGAELVFTGKGFGNDFVINSTINDVTHGPKPTLISWDPVVASCAIRLVWGVEVTIADCFPSVGSQYGKVAEFNYAINWSISDEGLTSRTISGQVEVIRRRVANGFFAGPTADDWREQILPTVPVGFRRVRQDFTLAPARNVMVFSFTDEQYPSDHPHHIGIVDADVTHSINNLKPMHFQSWIVSISGTYRVAKGWPKSFALFAFLDLASNRRQAAKFGAIESFGEKGNKSKPSPTFIPLTLSIQDDVYGRSMTFSISWKLLCGVGSLGKASGMLAKFGTNSWAAHGASMSTAWSPRGVSGLRFNQNGDRVMSLCDSTQPTKLIPEFTRNSDKIEPAGIFSDYVCPPKSRSWIYYRPHAELVDDSQQATLYPSGGSETYSPLSLSPGLGGGNIGVTSTGNTNAPRIHKRGDTQYRVIFSGTAERIGHTIPKVHLKTFGGVVATPVDSGSFRPRAKAINEKCKIYFASWRQEYILAGPPQSELYTTDPDESEFPQ